MQEGLSLVFRLCDLVAAIRRVFSWLGNMVDICNEKMGEPYQKCKNAFDKAISDCKKKLGVMSFLCEVVNGVSYVCHVARVGELLCLITDSIKNFIMDKVKSRIQVAFKQVHDMFYFNVSLVYHYNITFEQSKTFTEIRQDIMDEIAERLRPLQQILGIVNAAFIFLVLWVFVKAFLYRRKYLTKDRFDNYYITFSVRDIDERRQEMEKETILPLGWKEKSRYIKATSIRLAQPEKSKLFLGLIILMGSVLHAGFHLWCDYGLYWLLDMIRLHGKLKVFNGSPSRVKMHVQGAGILADMYRTLITTFDPMERVDLDIDTTPCLPAPIHPDLETYKMIGYIFALCLFLVLTEAYGLRLRHIVAGSYYPQRARERAVWLYNHILRRRGGFLKFMRRQLRRANEENEAIEKISILNKIAARFPCVARVLGWLGYSQKHCLACGAAGDPDDMDKFVHCSSPECKAVYCKDCFTDLNNLCTVCMSPIDYGDLSDCSEERDSSDEDIWSVTHTAYDKSRSEESAAEAGLLLRYSHDGEVPCGNDDGLDYGYQYAYEQDQDNESGRMGEEYVIRQNDEMYDMPPKELVSMDIFHAESDISDSNECESDVSDYSLPPIISQPVASQVIWRDSDHHR